MVSFPSIQARKEAFDLIRWLNEAGGKPAFALSGGVAFAAHGIQLPRPLGDIDIAALEPVQSAPHLRQLLLEAGCENLASKREFPKRLCAGCVSFMRNGMAFEILSQHARAATAPPLQADAARHLLERSRQNLCTINGVPVLDVDVIVAWKAILNRDKDRDDIRSLVTKTRSDGTPAIGDRDEVRRLVVANLGSHSKAVEFLDEALWPPWYGY